MSEFVLSVHFRMTMSIDECVALLRSQSDEQKFVGLLLATKLLKSPEDLLRLFGAAVPFLRRLLLTPSADTSAEDHGDRGNPYRAVALSVLATFAADPVIASCLEFYSCAINVGPLLANGHAMADEQIQDCATILFALLAPPGGVAKPAHAHVLHADLACAAAQPVSDCAKASCALLDDLAGAYHAGAATATDPGTCATVAVELLAAASILAPALRSLTDDLTWARLKTVRGLMEAAAAQLEPAAAVSLAATAKRPPPKANTPTPAGGRAPDAMGTAEVPAAVAEALAALAPKLRLGLLAPLSSKLPPAARADVLRAAATATRLCGPSWLLVEPSEAPTSDAFKDGAGGMLCLLLQLSSVELQLCLHDQPSEDISPSCLGVLPACCALLEEALFRLHSDAGGEEEDEGGADDAHSSTAADPWLDALSDAQVVTAQKAFERAILVALEYLETLRSEEAEAAAQNPAGAAALAPAPHPLLGPVARLVSSWLAQPSASQLLDPYDRACSVLPLLRSAAAGDQGAWAAHLRSFEREERAAASGADGDGDADPTDPLKEETMAELFTRLMPNADPAAREAMAKKYGWGATTS